MTEPPNGLLHQSQFFAYIQTDPSRADRELWGFEDDASLWTAYKTLLPDHENFAMQKVSEKQDIVPVFAKLFAKDKERSQAAEGITR